ncbi:MULTISPECIES: 2Fe-2S iron-sulfur cluster-binding protein [Myroides]|uniref:2Fe-2S iron-sulfur cluster binding domain-containing protein n=1 Tax=Myroides albus TaxID=2562892 RepID=A0A6I3LES8_9FLAO|nr:MULTISPECIES: 2Fe-2S iron-sulfur cluster-binding protein [Myroides]MTG96713.1 2Fe-2S iron-sulfur cluster binding domain-containing protein [Myroides albus]MVX35645.1 2Fe-2S iron-sulfur cluster binding domain-containing protein [Myroides sp. LoEW2-1]UVD80875.1 2Fe-2S iron-sulfur cluster-binding protein [Myroides albus]
MKVTIDGHEIEVEPGTTILQAARMIGGESVPPAMCYYSKLEGTGGKCRACLVEVSKGSEADPRPMPKLMASCKTGVMDGMEVKSISSPRVLEARKSVTEFLLINHPLDCPICDQAGECDLQNLAFQHGKSQKRYKEEKRTFEPEDIGPNIQLHMNRCILCYRCVKTAEQLTDKRVHGVCGRGEHAQISTYISAAIDNEFSGNMIDVCPVGALTDKTFRFKSRVWFNKPYNAHRNCPTCSGKVTLWMFGEEIQRVTARKDEFHEVEEFICNDCRFDHKDPKDWVIEGPRKFEKFSVINQNNYTKKLDKVVLNTEEHILAGREQDRKKISMKDIPYTEHESKE